MTKRKGPVPIEEGYWEAEDAPRNCLVIPDVHVPYHHEQAVRSMLNFAAHHKPDLAVQVGDFYDTYGISSYPKRPPKLPARLTDETKAGRKLWLEITRHCKRVKYIRGNHEERIEANVVQTFPALYGTPSMEPRNLFDIPPEVEIYSGDTKLKIGNVVICHGHKLKGSHLGRKHLAAGYASDYPCQNMIVGHHHRHTAHWQMVHHHDGPHIYRVNTLGWLGDPAQIEYANDPSYMHGFGWLEFWKEGGKVRHNYYQIEIIGGRCKFGGKVF